MGRLGFLTCLVLAGGGCSAASYARRADLAANAISAEKMRVVEDSRRDLLDPRLGIVPAAKSPGPAVEVPAELTLDEAVRIAVGHSREYKTQEEAFYLTALGLSLTRRNFLRPIFGGSLGYNGTDGRAIELSDSTVLALSATQRLPTGGTLTLSGAANVDTIDVGGSRTQDSGYTGTISITQQLWRGAGHTIAFEPLTQAERNAVYAARSFEIYRQNFTIGIIQSYLSLVNGKKRLAIAASEVARQDLALKMAKAQFRVARIGQEDVLRAEESYLNALNSQLDTEEAYKVQKDRFKIDLGVPLETEFEVVSEVPDPEPFELDGEGAVAAALHNRLDLMTERDVVADAGRNVAVARNALYPDLDLNASYSAFTGITNSLAELSFDNQVATFGLTLTFPFDRVAERNNYRSSLIALDQSRRSLVQAEDETMLQIRSLVRDLKTQIQTIDNNRKNIEVLKRRIIRAQIDFQTGKASNRDIVEASANLARAENELLARYVTYHVSRLNLLQQMGLLFVDKEGQIIP